MPIPAEYTTSNPYQRDALAEIPLNTGTHVGGFIAPDIPIDYEIVDSVTQSDHALNLDDLRAPDAMAKEIRFEQDTVTSVSVVERGLKHRIDTRKIEDAAKRGRNIVVQRTELLRQDILDAKEYRIDTMATTAASFGATHKASGTNFRTVDLVATVDAAREVILTDGMFEAEYGVIGRMAWRHARANAAFNTFAGSGGSGNRGQVPTLEAFAAWLQLKEVRLGNFRRKIGVATTFTEFFPADSFLIFANQKTLSTRTFAATPVVPYGPEFGPGNQVIDVRQAELSGVEGLTEIGAFHRYRPMGLNFNLGYLWSGVVGV